MNYQTREIIPAARDPQPATTQFLGHIETAACRECGKRVRWRVRSSYKCADGIHRAQYLYCPNCGAKAQRLILDESL